MDRITLVSGGLDSTILYKMYGGFPVFINYGQAYLEKELQAVQKIVPAHELAIIDVSGHTQVPASDFIPARNLFFASLVTMRFNPDVILMAGLRDDKVEDKNPAAFEAMSKVLTQFSRKEILVTSPFFEYSKGQIVEIFLRMFGNRKLLQQTVSCYSEENGLQGCLNCPACFRRYVAFFTNDIPTEPVSREIVLSYLPRLYTYDRDRISRTIIAMRPYFRSVLAVDIDGVLCELEPGHNYAERKPILAKIDEVNNRYMAGDLVLLYTSRLSSDRDITLEWLEKNRVNFHSLFTNKIPYDIIWDDKIEEV